MKDKFQFIDLELDARKQRRQLRTLKTVTPCDKANVTIAQRILVNFCANDYLGLSRHPVLSRLAAQHLERYGTGATASRLICGNQRYFQPVEERLAELKGTETALVFNSGFQANISILPALVDRSSLILSDRLNHNSIIQGTRLARCRVAIFNHNDMEHLELLLKESEAENFSRRLIVTESIFSMDGDQCAIDHLVALAGKYNAILVVDEAHATGVTGKNGMGLTCGKGVDVVIGTFSKACGAFGAYVACTQRLRDYLINCCAGIIYSTALPPAAIGAIAGALELIPEMDEARHSLQQNADYLRTALRRQGWDCGRSTTQIVPVIVGDEAETTTLSQYLEDHGIFVQAIRPPTVEANKSRLRLALSALHSKNDIQRVIDALAQWKATQ